MAKNEQNAHGKVISQYAIENANLRLAIAQLEEELERLKEEKKVMIK